MKKIGCLFTLFFCTFVLFGVTSFAEKLQNHTALPFSIQEMTHCPTVEALNAKLKRGYTAPINFEQKKIKVPEDTALPLNMRHISLCITYGELNKQLKAGYTAPVNFSPKKDLGEDFEEEETEMESQEQERAYSKVIMVGDSRFVGMSSAISHPTCQWICEVSMGYDWLASQAIPIIDASVGPETAIVLNLGVNDLGRSGDYANLLNSKIAGWNGAGADVFFMSVNPVTDGYGGAASNGAIEGFNNVIVSQVPGLAGYLDTYHYLVKYGFGTGDGLHYDASTSVAIFNYMLEHINIANP